MDLFEEDGVSGNSIFSNIVDAREAFKLPMWSIKIPEYAEQPDSSFTRKHTRPTSSVYTVPTIAATADLPHSPSLKSQARESDTKKRSTLLQEGKKYIGKAERKRLKKQKQKEKKQLTKMEKEKQTPSKSQNGGTGVLECEIEESTRANDASKNNPRGTQQVAAKHTDSNDSGNEDSSEEDGDVEKASNILEGLDMSSLLVGKAADIARRNLDQSLKQEKKIPVKEEPKTSTNEPSEKPTTTKDRVASSSVTVKDNVKISTDLANLGSKSASAGSFNAAVMYFTEAIKFNPKEYKLFGNRSFCFERMQEYEKALTDAELSLSMCPGWVKGLFRKGRALAGLQRYDEACQAFREVLAVDGSCAEAAQELMRVQITQVMEYGFTREESSKALISHGTVQKAVEVLRRLNKQAGSFQNGAPSASHAANGPKVSAALSAANHRPPSPKSQNAPLHKKPIFPSQNRPNFPGLSKPPSRQAQELFPVWVGNLFQPATESDIRHVFSKVGVVFSVKLLSYKRCAFVNYTVQEHCDEAILRFNGFDLNGSRIVVRYPDRIPEGMGISSHALTAIDIEECGRDMCSARTPVGGRGSLPTYGQYRASDYD